MHAHARCRSFDRLVRRVRPRSPGSFFRFAIDLLAIWFAFWLAYQLRYVFEIGGQVYEFNQRNVFRFLTVALRSFAVFCMVVFLVRGVYRLSSWTTLLDEMGLVAGSVTMAMGGLLLTAYLSQFSPSRLALRVRVGSSALGAALSRTSRDAGRFAKRFGRATSACAEF